MEENSSSSILSPSSSPPSIPSSRSSTTINDLADDLLIEIFVRLDNYGTGIRCKLASKRWLSILSNPRFVMEYINHKNILPSHKKEHLPWTFFSTMRMTRRMNKKIPTHKVFNSSKFTLNFLPSKSFAIMATCKDLVLCIDTSKGKDHHNNQYYYICNPLTKQWIALPPLPISSHDCFWVRLFCKYPECQGNIDCRLRVVVIHPIPMSYGPKTYDPYKSFNSMVFCSENSLWKNINLRIPLSILTKDWLSFNGAVCKGMVCIRHDAHFGVFNPFHITPNSGDEHVARKIRPLFFPGDGITLECGSRLISLCTTITRRSPDWDVLYGEVSIIVEEGDFNGVDDTLNDSNSKDEVLLPCRIYRQSCIDDLNEIIMPKTSTRLIGIHPTNKQLIYLENKVCNNKVVETSDNEANSKDRTSKLVLLDRNSSHLKILGELHPDRLDSPCRLELQHWPTPLPRISD